jgi:chloramphenicol O-acetyltransferase type A
MTRSLVDNALIRSGRSDSHQSEHLLRFAVRSYPSTYDRFMEKTIDGEAVQIDRRTWARGPLYDLFRNVSDPFHGVCLRVDCTETFRYAKDSRTSLFLALLHRSLTAAQHIENFMTRIVEGEAWQYKVIHGESAVGRANGTIGFGHYPYQPNLHEFVLNASREVERVKERHDLEKYVGQNVMLFSALPWFDFTSISHARDSSWRDSAPRITFGKVTEAAGKHTMPVSIHVHHGLADGLHVAQFVEQFERCLASPESI